MSDATSEPTREASTLDPSESIRYIDLLPVSELFGPTAGTADGWRIPVEGQGISYLYVGLIDFAFEVWLGGDADLTVKLERPFRFGSGEELDLLDPRTSRKSEIAQMLAIGQLTVGSFFVTQTGRLEIEFIEGQRLVAEPASDGRAWIIGWPEEGPSRVASAIGGGIAVISPDEPWAGPGAVPESAFPTALSLEPVRRGTDLILPIQGVVAICPLSGASVELMLPIRDGGYFCMHFGGEVAIKASTGLVWQGKTGWSNDDLPTLGPMLDLVGGQVIEARVDTAERLCLDFEDGRELTAEPGAWEAHWPMTAGRDEHWVPREGPNIP